ncbi:thioredoxin family protein [Aureibaculum sp. 2210JD6-5]|uniref:TlpA family protein disulfide reductase n=1 Tax=Aureibaculum sp. 2210JD6-5 TaxID=3103957 RepID=UPI002AAD6C1F|nr:thioredoxin family protein [Aureibaculum sp. 2210JD6-5]MDY7395958.1 thioredoxin family protein [Aureibaculum sp. 2210JD6-5]
MKNLIFIAVCTFLFSGYTFAQQKEIIAKPNYIEGVTSQDAFKDTPYNTWFNRNYDGYKLDEATVKEIKKNLKGVTIKAFMGTWCGDSRREVPHFYKLLESAGFDESNLEMIGVNYGKKTTDNLQEGLNIIRVPTFIFYKKDKEIGRYVEYARETLEKDILKILKEEPYKHSYDKS